MSPRRGVTASQPRKYLTVIWSKVWANLDISHFIHFSIGREVLAGYIFNLDSYEALKEVISLGTYSARFNDLMKNKIILGWKNHHLSTIADFVSMKEGDSVYFFHDRKIYGIGKICNVGDNCKYLNFPGADNPKPFPYVDVKSRLLFDNAPVKPKLKKGQSESDIANWESEIKRFVFFFRPAEVMYENGIDMDDVLLSSPDKFKMLRVFYNVTFIKLADEENQALKDIILRRNKRIEGSGFPFSDKNHVKVLSLINANPDAYEIKPIKFLKKASKKKTDASNEMAVETALISYLSEGSIKVSNIFGNWDYISHQVVASPFKGIIWMDRIDIFGYKYLDTNKTTIDKFLVIEVKKGVVGMADVLQVMKYVDFVKSEYAYNEYSNIEAYLVGNSFSDDVVSRHKELAKRAYLYGVKPPVAEEWSSLELIRYDLDDVDGEFEIDFTKVS